MVRMLNSLFTQRCSIAKNVGCFRRNLFVSGFVGVFVYTITSKRVNTGWWNLGRCIVQKSWPSSNLGVIAPCNFVWIAILCQLELIWPFIHIRQVAPHSQRVGAVTAVGSDSGHCNVWSPAMTLGKSVQAVWFHSCSLFAYNQLLTDKFDNRLIYDITDCCRLCVIWSLEYLPNIVA